ncbi:MAG: DUF4124 domain-containing protein [Dechloromonas sp.]|nr:MAG: DUF4124 domain-containing protein [Dechloromonas sp.]
MSTATALTAHAQTYQWKDSSGRTVISDTPPPGSARDARGIGLSPPPSSSAPKAEAAKAADAPKTTAEKTWSSGSANRKHAKSPRNRRRKPPLQRRNATTANGRATSCRSSSPAITGWSFPTARGRGIRGRRCQGSRNGARPESHRRILQLIGLS